MIYLDNAATGGMKPECVQNAVLSALKTCANPGRSGHRLSVALAERVYACRNLLCDLFDGYAPERVAFTKNCTEALNIAICGVLQAGDHAVTTALEHNSVLRPLQAMRGAGADYSVAPLREGKTDPEAIASLVTEKTKLVVVTSASNVTGERPDLKAIRALLPDRVLLVVDGAQGAGHIPLRMKECGIDALALAGHKGLHAVQGAGALLFSERFEPRPLLFGGTGSESMNLSMPEFYPDRLESGTLSYPAVASLFEGALFVKSHLEEHAGQLTYLTETVREELKALPSLRLYSEPNPCGIVAFAHKKLASEEVSAFLSDEFDIATRGGLHCAPLAHKALGTFPSGLVRASFSPFQGSRQAYALVRALKRLG